MKKILKNTTQRIPKKIQLFILISTIVLLIALIVVIVTTFIRRRGRDSDIITLTYANANLGANHNDALELRMIQSFMDAHPNIRIEIDQNITSPWTDSLASAARQNRLPDVFMLEDISIKAANGWLMDITSHVWADVDFFDLTGSIQEAMRLGGTMYAVPFAQHIHGYFVNRDLFRDMGMEPPSFGVSAGDFVEAIRAATDLNRPSIGLNHAFSFADWYPGAVNPLLGFFAFDGLGFALNSPEMREGIHLASELYSNGYTFDGIPYTGNFAAGNDLGVFMEGQMAFFYAGSWLADLMVNQAGFDWEFIGVPGGRSVITLEVVGISSTTDHPDEAYLFAKWMGHGTEGSLQRLKYAQEMDVIPSSWPVSQNREVMEELFQILPIPGLTEVYESLYRALIDGLRVLPGYMQARFTAPTGINIYGSRLADIGVDQLIRYSITGYAYFPDHGNIAEEIARYQFNSASAPFLIN